MEILAASRKEKCDRTAAGVGFNALALKSRRTPNSREVGMNFVGQTLALDAVALDSVASALAVHPPVSGRSFMLKPPDAVFCLIAVL
ncbi:MAG: hypothetical protein JOZ60_02545 [Verrucomicrobia bacterium]|nr:hypothetical protein [Verrucomicrobiota bacterium]